MKKIPVRKIKPAFDDPVPSGRFSIRELGTLLQGKDLNHELHRHDFYFILLLEEGKGTHEIDFKKHNISDHSVFFLRPGQVHQLELKSDCKGYIMEFDIGFYHPSEKLSVERFRRAGNKNFCRPDLSRFEKLSALLSHIQKEYITKEEGYMDVIKANLEIFIIEYIRQSSDSKKTPAKVSLYTQQRLEEYLELLEKHITTYKQVSEYTQLMNLSAYQLNEITKATLAKTPSELINEYIILEAKRNLLATSNQVKDIADQLGYGDVSYFIRFFKKHTGKSPELFRQNSR